MRALFKLVLWLIFLSPVALAALAWFSLSDDALVLNTSRLSHKDVVRAQAVLKKNDPRQLPAGSEQTITLSEQDLNLAANYLLQRVAEAGAQVRVHDGFVDAVGTLRIPGLPKRQYLNISLQVEDRLGTADVRSLRLGDVTVPPALARFALAQAVRQLYHTNEYQLASNLVTQFKMRPRELQITYRADPDLVERARSTLLSPGDAEALAAYHAKLLQLQGQGVGVKGSLTKLLQPMFAHAKQRSRDGDPVTENQALLAILGAWSSHRGLKQLVPDAGQEPKRFRLKLQKRTDFAQHFLTSAALAAKGDGALADAIGLAKEIADSDGGSGFSFTDIAADRAGTRFGELATASPQQARRLQNFMSKPIKQRDIMPKATDLPEHMSRVEFERRFGGVGSPAYEKVINKIEKRIANTRLFKKLG